MINIYTDGSSIGNPGPGGFGVILEWEGKGYTKNFSKGFKITTNNRMEPLEFLKKTPSNVTVFSDSKYVIDSVQKKWLFKWEKNKFKGKKNTDLWQRFLLVYRKHNVNFKWIKGHNNHPQNEYCDKIAAEAAKSNNLFNDYFFENELKSKQ